MYYLQIGLLLVKNGQLHSGIDPSGRDCISFRHPTGF